MSSGGVAWSILVVRNLGFLDHLGGLVYPELVEGRECGNRTALLARQASAGGRFMWVQDMLCRSAPPILVSSAAQAFAALCFACIALDISDTLS